MNELARELNTTLEATIVGKLLSAAGRRMYFPRGIVVQSGEAKQYAHRLNATAGIATQGGQPLFLAPIRENIPNLPPEEIFSYATTTGDPRLRELWLREMIEKNPSLKDKKTSLPIVVSGLTHGLSLLADLFIGAGDTVIVPDLFWGNYRLIFEDRMGAHLLTFPLFSTAGALNLEALESLLKELEGGKVILLLNFPNNPTGYSPTKRDAKQLLDLLGRAAETGTRLLLIADDAYFGLFYEQDIYCQSMFAEAADLHENILAVKVDGATKENLVWGFRVGFLTFASRDLRGEEDYAALTQKVMGAIRCSVSSASTLSQSLVLRGMQSPAYGEEKKRVFAILRERYLRSRQILKALSGPIRALPFNSGYFLSFDTGALSAERLRQALLKEQGIGTISIQDRYLRVAYSSVDVERLEDLYKTIMQTASDLS
jgi:aspartate/methionine/tyrosine aminotransferase